MLERLLEEVSFDAPDRDGEQIAVDKKFVEDRLGELVQDQDLSQYIL